MKKPLVTRVKKGKNKVFNNAKFLLPNQHSLSMKIFRVSFVGYSMSSGINQFIEL